MEKKQRIAIVGGGITGMACAYALSKKHHVTLYEASHKLGGHADTEFVNDGGKPIGIDMGFIVLNDRTYPAFSRLLQTIGVTPVRSDMSFCVSRRTDANFFEYAGHFKGLFGRLSPWLDKQYRSMLADLIRLYRQGQKDSYVSHKFSHMSLQQYVENLRLGEEIYEFHIKPMVAAIWSTPHRDVGTFPAQAFLDFFRHHGLFHFFDRPTWYTIKGGSQAYVSRLSKHIDQIQLNMKVHDVIRDPNGHVVVRAGGISTTYDIVVLAVHADNILSMLGDSALDAEKKLLAAVQFSSNKAVLHTDTSQMPYYKNVWSSWNVLQHGNHSGVSLTYWMNKLQPLRTNKNYFVTLNPSSSLDHSQICAQRTYKHPLMNHAMRSLQENLSDLQGHGGIYYGGAWSGYGFHEDGAEAGFAIAARIGSAPEWWHQLQAKSSARKHVGS